MSRVCTMNVLYHAGLPALSLSPTHHTGSLKSAMVGVFTPQKSSPLQVMVFFLENCLLNIYQHPTVSIYMSFCLQNLSSMRIESLMFTVVGAQEIVIYQME